MKLCVKMIKRAYGNSYDIAVCLKKSHSRKHVVAYVGNVNMTKTKLRSIYIDVVSLSRWMVKGASLSKGLKILLKGVI